VKRTHINWGVIGCAGIADNAVIPAINNASNANLYALASRNKDKLEKFKKKHNPFKTYEDYERIIDDPEVDAVYIPLPNSMHYAWVLKAAEKKKHILCEKPMACTSKETLAMKEACERNGVILMEGYAYRHSPVTLKLKELIEQNAVGKVKLIETYLTFTLGDDGNIRAVKELGGGAVYDVGCYSINIMRYLAGSEPVTIYATGEIHSNAGVDWSCYGILNFEDNLKGMFHGAFNCPYRNEYKITGEKGVIQVPRGFNAEGELEIIVQTGEKVETLIVSTPNNYLLEIEQFGRCVLEGERPRISMEESYRNACVTDKVLQQIFKPI